MRKTRDEIEIKITVDMEIFGLAYETAIVQSMFLFYVFISILFSSCLFVLAFCFVFLFSVRAVKKMATQPPSKYFGDFRFIPNGGTYFYHHQVIQN